MPQEEKILDHASEQPLTKKQKRALKKIQQKQRVMQEKTQKTRQKFASAIVVVVAILVVVLLIVLVRRPAKVSDVSGSPDPSRGASTAKVILKEYSDFACPSCNVLHTTLEDVVSNYSDSVQLIFNDFPLPNHLRSRSAAEAAQCADKQGKFWEYHDQLFDKQSEWPNLGESDAENFFMNLGKDASISDQDAFQQCIQKQQTKDLVEEDYKEGVALDINSTPTLFINDERFTGAMEPDELKSKIDALLAQESVNTNESITSENVNVSVEDTSVPTDAAENVNSEVTTSE